MNPIRMISCLVEQIQSKITTKMATKPAQNKVDEKKPSRIDCLTQKVLGGRAELLEITELKNIFAARVVTCTSSSAESQESTHVIESDEVSRACDRIVKKLLFMEDLSPEYQPLLHECLRQDTELKQNQLKKMLSLEDDKVYPVLFQEKEVSSIVPGHVVNLINHVLYQEQKQQQKDVSIPKIGQELVHEYFTRKILLTHPLEQRQAIIQTLAMIQNFEKKDLPEVSLSPTMIPPEILLTVLGPLLGKKELGALYKMVATYNENDKDALAIAIRDRIHERNVSFSSFGLSQGEVETFLDKRGNSFSNLNFSDESIEEIIHQIKKTPNLRSVTLEGNATKGLGSIYETIPGLEKIRIGLKIKAQDLEALTKFKNLREFFFIATPDRHANEYDQVLAKIIDSAPHLHTISIPLIGPETAKSLSQKSNISHLLFNNNPIDNTVLIPIFKNNPNLETLILDDFRGNIPTLMKLSYLHIEGGSFESTPEILWKTPNLETFVGRTIRFDDNVVNSLPEFKKLRTITLQSCSHVVPFLKKATQVEHLFLENLIVHPLEQFDEVPELENLQVLEVKVDDLKEEHLFQLVSKAKNLQYLYIYESSQVTGEKLSTIPHLSTLKELHIEFCEDQQFSLESMNRILTQNTQVQVFCYSTAEFGESWQMLAKKLKAISPRILIEEKPFHKKAKLDFLRYASTVPSYKKIMDECFFFE